MQQMLPLLLDWLADSPDPDQGLLSLRKLALGSQRSTELASLFRDSPEAARRVCALIGASGMVVDAVLHNPDLIARLPDFEQLRTCPKPALVESARKALAWRDDVEERQSGLRRWKERHLVGITARDVLGEADVATVGRDVERARGGVARGRARSARSIVAVRRDRSWSLRGAELSYVSDLDVLFVYEGPTPADFAEAEKLATGPPIRGRCDSLGSALGGRRGPASRRKARSVGPQRRGLRDVLLPMGPGVGATGDDPRPAGRG